MPELPWEPTEVVFAPAAMDAATLDRATPDSALIVLFEMEYGRAKPLSLLTGADISGKTGVVESITAGTRVTRIEREGTQELFVFGEWTVERLADGNLSIPGLDVPQKLVEYEILKAFDRFLPGRPPKTRRVRCLYPTPNGPCGHINEVESLEPAPPCVNGSPPHTIVR